MENNDQILDIAKKTVVYRIPGMDSVTIRRDLEYVSAGGGRLKMDIYHPDDWKLGGRTPGVIIVAGYRDLGVKSKLGCEFKDMGSSISWARLMAASGLAAVTYSNQEPAEDLAALTRDVRQNAAVLGIDENRIGLWACSGSVPLALSVLMQENREYLRCAALCYGYMLDPEGSTAVAEAAQTFGFSNPSSGKSVNDLRRDVALFIARAGQDRLPHLNETIDRFVMEALTLNLPITLANHPEGPHAFDLLSESETSRQIVRGILAFLRLNLLS